MRRLGDDRRVWLACAVLATMALSAIFASQIAPYDPRAHLDIVNLNGKPPSAAHPFGTDTFSRDVLSRLIHGSRVSLSVAVGAVALAISFGTMVGVIAGYNGGAIDALLMRIVDAVSAIPNLLLIIVVVALWGDIGTLYLTLLIAAVNWFTVARLVRTETLAVRDSDYVIAARALGTRATRILMRHVLPNVAGPAIIASALSIGNVILLEAGMSYLGIGVRPPDPSWGSIIQDGSERVYDLWWLTLFPGLAILVTVFACNGLADALRDALDPRQLPATMTDDTSRRVA